MKITTVKYGRTFSLGQFQSERIDFECEIEDNETPEQILLQLKERVEQFHKETNDTGRYVTAPDELRELGIHQIYTSSPNIFEPPSTLTPEERTIKEIEKTTTIEQLNEYQLLTKSNKAILAAYDLQMLKLKQKI